MIRVYHRFSPDLETFPQSEIKSGSEPLAYGRSQLTPVAEVATDSLSMAFNLTHRQPDWWKHPKVTALFQSQRCRSTVVGDVMELNGLFYRVMPFAFKIVRVSSANRR